MAKKLVAAEGGGSSFITLFGTEGDDELHGTDDADGIAALDGDDDVYGGAQGDMIWGGNGKDVLFGQAGDDALFGDAGADYLVGGEGNDILDGGAGNDLMAGGNGDNDYRFGVGSGRDDIQSFGSGSDRVLLGAGITKDDIVLWRPPLTDSLVISIKGSKDQLTIQSHFSDWFASSVDAIVFADGTVWGLQDIVDNMQLTDHDDEFHGTSGNDFINGLRGDDWLFGGAGDDFLIGGAGDDLFSGEAGNDSFQFGLGVGDDAIFAEEKAGDLDQVVVDCGITAADVTVDRAGYMGGDLVLTINGADDSLTIYDYFDTPEESIDLIQFADGTSWDMQDIFAMVNVATAKDDYLEGSASGDQINGLNGNDTILGHEGSDILLGGGGHDDLFGGSGNDVLTGGGGWDFLYGDTGNDVLIAGGGGGLLSGDGGKDTLLGGAGEDALIGGTGSDMMTGGAGRDQFEFDAKLDAAKNVDTINDFASAEDIIVLGREIFTKFQVTYQHLNADFFVASLSGDAVDADDRILYETDTGKLFYDADGNGVKEKVLFAVIGQDTHPALTADSIFVF